MPATLLEARGIRATAFRPPPGNCAVQGRQFPAPGYRAAQGRRPSGPRAIARRKGEGLPSPGSASRKAGGHACTPPGSARCKGSGLSALGQSHDARAASFRPPGNRAAQGRRPSVSRKRPAQGWRTCPQPSWKRAAQRRRPSGPGKSCGARAKAFRPQEIARRKGGGLPSPEKRLAQGWRTCLQPSWKRAARGRRLFGPGQSRGARAAFPTRRAFRREMPLFEGRRLAEEAAGRAQKTRPAAEWGWAGSGSERGISGRTLWKHPGAAAGPRAASGQGPEFRPGGCGRRGCRCRPP